MKNGIGTMLSAQCDIGREITRILREIFLRTELRGIDEDTHENRPLLSRDLSRAIDKRCVAAVKCTHRRDEHK